MIVPEDIMDSEFSSTNKQSTSTMIPRRKRDLLLAARKSRMEWIDQNVERHKNSTPQNDEALNKVFRALDLMLTPSNSETIHSETSNCLSRLKLLSTDSNRFHGQDIQYKLLLTYLKHPLAREIVDSMRKYVLKFERNSIQIKQTILNSDQHIDFDRIRQDIWNYMDNIHLTMKECDLWKKLPAEEWIQHQQNIERFIFLKLHTTLLNLIQTYEIIQQDKKIYDRTLFFTFLQPSHLDLKLFEAINFDDFIQEPLHKLQKISQYTHPLDQIQIITDCTQLITYQLNHLKSVQTQLGNQVGVDVFLPILVLLFQRLQCPTIYSIIYYIQYYIRIEKYSSEMEYIMTCIMSALQFLEVADYTQLSITEREYQIYLQEYNVNQRKLTTNSTINLEKETMSNVQRNVHLKGFISTNNTVTNDVNSDINTIVKSCENDATLIQIMTLLNEISTP